MKGMNIKPNTRYCYTGDVDISVYNKNDECILSTGLGVIPINEDVERIKISPIKHFITPLDNITKRKLYKNNIVNILKRKR